jgi:hypothetical protein
MNTENEPALHKRDFNSVSANIQKGNFESLADGKDKKAWFVALASH